MAKKKNQELITRQSVTPAQINRLVKKALKNSIEHTPSKGCKFIKDLKLGSLFQVEQGPTRGVLISSNHNATVIITETYEGGEIGRQNISANTSVKEITKV